VGHVSPELDKLVVAALGDLIQITDFQEYLEQQVLNVYYYRITSLTGLSDPYLPVLGDWFRDNVVEAVRAIQSPSALHLSRELRNLSNGADLYTDNEVLDGTNTTTGSGNLPSYVSLGFILRRESLVTRNGYKRIAGVIETNVAGNDFQGDLPEIAAIEEALAADIVIGLATVAEPIIVKRPIIVPVEDYEYASIGSAQFRGLGTQNSRKRGRGI